MGNGSGVGIGIELNHNAMWKKGIKIPTRVLVCPIPILVSNLNAIMNGKY